MGHPHLRLGGAVGAQTLAQQRHPLCDITIFHLDPAAEDELLGAKMGKTLLSCYGS